MWIEKALSILAKPVKKQLKETPKAEPKENLQAMSDQPVEAAASPTFQLDSDDDEAPFSSSSPYLDLANLEKHSRQGKLPLYSAFARALEKSNNNKEQNVLLWRSVGTRRMVGLSYFSDAEVKQEIHRAVQENDHHGLYVLLEELSPNRLGLTTFENNKALRLAIYSGYVDIVKCLLNIPEVLTAITGQHNEAILKVTENAGERGDFSVVECLLEVPEIFNDKKLHDFLSKLLQNKPTYVSCRI